MDIKIRLNALSEMEMNQMKGGVEPQQQAYCGCGCAHAKNGGSSTMVNGHANARNWLVSPGIPYDKLEFFSDLPECEVTN